MLSVQREEASNSFASVQRSLNTLNIFRVWNSSENHRNSLEVAGTFLEILVIRRRKSHAFLTQI